VPPTIIFNVVADSVMVATGAGATTDRLADPCLAPTVAVTLVEPATSPVTTPLEVMDASAAEPVLQLIVPNAIVAPFWSNPDAVAFTVDPTVTVELDILTVIVVSTGVTGPVPPELLIPPPQETLAPAATRRMARRMSDA